MKLLSSNRQHGGTLLATLIIGITVGTVLGAYLSLVGNRYELTMRSQCWNTAIPVLEAGIEDALTHLRDDVGQPTANGWTNGTVGGQSILAKQRTLNDGNSYYTVIYNAGTTNPYIYSTGMIPAPRHRNTYISRTVKVNGTNPPLFSVSLGAVYGITLNGSSVASDSFNSSPLSPLNTNGRYDPAKTSTNGSMASVYGPVNLGNHTIKGDLYLGPSVTPPSLSAGQVTGKVYSDFNVSYPDVVLPTTSWQAPPAITTVNGKQVYDFKADGDYQMSNPTTGVIIEPGVHVRLHVTTTAYLPDSIHVMATNSLYGTLAIYQDSGSGTLNNVVLDEGRARALSYFGLPAVTSITYGGTGSFTGVIYAPEANLTLNGGGGSTGIIGSAIVKSITLNGSNFAFHYDEDLLSHGPGRGLVISSWQEL